MTNSSQIHNNVVPSEVGWQFVPQYYTFVNKQPNRLHCFYTKASTFIHGTEGEDGKPCFGQQEIHNRITSIGFQDCKVFIHSVDAQSSANGGIIIQVIGEMSNRGEAWRKFVQTFFLAEQPNGYFVLNDIFRFLKEETVDSDEDREDPMPAGASSTSPSQPTAPMFENPTEPEEVNEPSASSSPAPPAEEPIPAAQEEAPEPQANGTHTPAPAEPEPEPEPVVEKSPIPAPAATLAPEPTPAPTSRTASPAAPVPAAPQPAPSPAPPSQAAQPPSQPAPPAQPAAPPAPKTWANLAAANSKKWGSAVAQESRGVTEVPVTSTPPNGQQSPAPREGSSTPHPAYAAAQSITTPQCFVKGVVENVSEAALRQIVTQRYGAIKELEIVRNKACAFLEFVHLDSAKRAIIASLPPTQGGGGGVRIEGEGGVQVKIFIETKKERGDRPVSRPRGGPPPSGGDRGGFRGRGAPGGGRGGRGAAPPK